MPTMSTKPQPNEGLEEGEECCCSCWTRLPDSILLHIFSFLSAPHLYQVGLVCKPWLRVAFDELLWKDLFYRHWAISRSIPMAPGKYSWIQEYKRLLYHTPSVESEVLKQHGDQVLHVSFSHNGKMFATCSKDGFIRVWDTCYPTSLKYKADMRKFTWKYTQFSQFNATDTLLLVSGVHFGSLSTSGEIAVFSLEGDFVMQSRVMNKPYDVFGTWYNDCYLLSGNLHWAGHLNSCSVLWLNKAYQETMSETESVVMRLFKFSNINASSIRTIMVAECLNQEQDTVQPEKEKDEGDSRRTSLSDVRSPLIRLEIANQNDAKNEMDNEEEKEGHVEKKKTLNKVQGVQVYENGCLCTKFVELDDEDSNGKLNGTIEYSRDYRMAEGPSFSDELNVEGSNADIECASSGASSEFSQHTSSGSLKDMDNGNGNGLQARSNLENINKTFGLNDNATFNIELENVENSAKVDFMDDSCQADFSAGNVSVAYDYEIATEVNNSAVNVERSEEPVATEFSVEISVDNVDNNKDENTLNLEENAPYHIDLDLGEPVPGDNLQKSQNDKPVDKSDSMDASFFASNKRILHGQQLEQGSKFRDPSTSDLENDDFCSSSSQSISIPSASAMCAEPTSFCCVDYKKLRKSTKQNIPLKQKEFLSVSNQEDLEMPGPSSSPSKNQMRKKGSKKQFKSKRLLSDNELDMLFLDSSDNVVLGSQSEPRGADQPEDKYLIFTKGSETYTPHQIGIKRIKRLKAFNDSGQLLPNVEDNTQGLERGEDTYDEVDHLIDMNGHIIGMCLSPDQRYLYVNSRPWPKNYHIENPLYPPPIAQEIDIHVIDLTKMREVGTMHRAHKAYTSNDECFFIFLDVCDEYVASGAEDKHGYLWDRHYGLCLKKYPHSDVVNSVAFNPMDPEVLVTVSDDFSIKIWRSLSRQKEVISAFNLEHCIRLRHVRAIMSDTSDDLEQTQDKI